MGFLSRLSGADGIGKGLARIDELVDAELARGKGRFVVPVRDTDFPLVARNSYLVTTVIEHLSERGLSVQGVDSDDRRGMSYLHVQSEGEVDSSDMPTAAGTSDDTEDLSGEVRAFRALKRWTTKKSLGVPFGPEHGLEEAKDVVGPYFTEDPDYLRLCGTGIAKELGRQHKAGNLKFDAWDQVMGINDQASRRYGVNKRQALVLMECLNEAKQLVIDMIDDTGNTFNKWQDSDELALRAYVLHEIVYQRFGSAGVLDINDL